jgi:hypothetical protein
MPHGKKLLGLVLAIIFVLVVMFIGVAGVLYLYKTIKIEVSQIYLNQLNTSHYLISSMDYNVERQRLVLFSRDKILERNKNLKIDHAFFIASVNVKYSEIYPTIDPLMLLAVQDIESAFNPTVISPMGAIGLNQVMPVTARHLCKGLGIAFKDSLLYDIDFNTRLGVMILDDAMATYSKHDIALACYNGGPWSAYYYKINSDKLPEETKKYIPNILKKWEDYRLAYKQYRLKTENLVKTNDAEIDENLLKK